MSKKLAALLLALMMILGSVSALAEATETAEAVETAEAAETAETAESAETADAADAAEETAAAEPVLLATVNGESIMSDNSAMSQLVNYYVEYYAAQGYDTDDESFLTVVKDLGLRWAIEDALYRQKAAELGVADMTEEQKAELEAAAKEIWEEIVSYFVSLQGLADDASEEDKAAARADALATIESMYGYTESSYIEGYVESYQEVQMRENVEKAILGEITLSDEEESEYFNELVEEDRQQYEGQIFMYEYMTSYAGQTSFYVPEGYRGVTHILLNVDQELMDNYTNLSAKLEEQEEAATSDEAVEQTEGEAAAAETAAPAEGEAGPEATEEPVTEEMVAAARQAILDSVQPTVDEIMAKYNAGTPFADLIAEYGNDPGMQEEPYKSKGYAVHAESILYDPAFTAGAMSLEKVGDVSEPILGSYGIHLIHYTRDIPAGAVELTDEEREDLRAQALSEKENDQVEALTSAWLEAADIQYTEDGQKIIDEAAALNEVPEESVTATDATEETLADGE